MGQVEAKRTPMCCYFLNGDSSTPCRYRADWSLYFGSGIEDYSEACSVHVLQLAEDIGARSIFSLRNGGQLRSKGNA